MAHGSKKWIKDATGRVKRSRNRTKKDYYVAVEYWQEYTPYRNYGISSRWGQDGDFCPQCKGVAKEIRAEREAADRRRKKISDEYETLYGEANRQWRKYHSDYNAWLYRPYGECVKYPTKPKVAEPTEYYKYLRENGIEFFTSFYYHWRNFLCYKHERYEEMQREMWYNNVPGQRKHWNVGKRLSRMYYRQEVKNKMQRAKYIEDFEGYDEILPRRKEWLD